MEILENKIKKKLEELDELYDSYLTKLDDPIWKNNIRYFEGRLHDIRIEMNTLKEVLEMIEDGKDNNI